MAIVSVHFRLGGASTSSGPALTDTTPVLPADPIEGEPRSEQHLGPGSTLVSDKEIVGCVLAGDIRLFEVLMRRHNQRLFRAARSILHSDDEAEDVMQDAYARAFEHLADFRGTAQFSTWLTRIAVHEALARLRRANLVARLDAQHEEGAHDMASSASTPEQHVSDTELRSVIESAIDELPPEFRVVFVLRVVEQMNVADVAECLGIPQETVKTRLFRARQRLKRRLMDRLDDAAGQAFEFHLVRCDRVVAGAFERIARSSRHRPPS
jgi:RNA polymerase sigma-70 factor, ECF subfamily